jgi:uncharacterized DUF497 family protein
MIVEWDEKKNLQNIKKHKISFFQAAYVFTDSLRKEDYDTGHSSLEEDRISAIGMAGNIILYVSFTEPNAEIVRIISARKAKKHEMEY